jgi:DNA polymerase-3 subunit beta
MLFKNLKMVQRATDQKSNIIVLRNVLFDLCDGRLKLTGYDHRIGIKSEMECDVEVEGSITVPCALLLEVLDVVHEERVSFMLEESILHMTCGKSKYDFSCFPADDFPSLPTSEEKDMFNLVKDVLQVGIRQTLYSTAPDDPRAFMGGILVKIEKGVISFVATDGHRLVVRKFEAKDVLEKSIIVPARAMAEVLKILSDAGEEPIKVAIDDKKVSFTIGSVVVVSRLVEAEFPKYEKIIPAKSDGICRVNRIRMIAAVKGASIMSQSKDNKDLIAVKVVDDSMNFSASTQDIGSADEEIDVAKKGKDVSIAFNARFILDFLNAIEDEEVLFEYVGEVNPGVFHADSPDYIYILMPIKA